MEVHPGFLFGNVYTYQGQKWVTGIDPHDPVTHWAYTSEPD